MRNRKWNIWKKTFFPSGEIDHFSLCFGKKLFFSVHRWFFHCLDKLFDPPKLTSINTSDNRQKSHEKDRAARKPFLSSYQYPSLNESLVCLFWKLGGKIIRKLQELPRNWNQWSKVCQKKLNTIPKSFWSDLPS